MFIRLTQLEGEDVTGGVLACFNLDTIVRVEPIDSGNPAEGSRVHLLDQDSIEVKESFDEIWKQLRSGGL